MLSYGILKVFDYAHLRTRSYFFVKEHVYQVSLRYLAFYSSYRSHSRMGGRTERQSLGIEIISSSWSFIHNIYNPISNSIWTKLLYSVTTWCKSINIGNILYMYIQRAQHIIRNLTIAYNYKYLYAILPAYVVKYVDMFFCHSFTNSVLFH